MIENNELERCGRMQQMAEIEILSKYLPPGTEKNHKNSSARMTGVLVKIRTRHLQNKYYHLNQLAGF
jgi:hypothetical protein